jgi:hypothetical protein
LPQEKRLRRRTFRKSVRRKTTTNTSSTKWRDLVSQDIERFLKLLEQRLALLQLLAQELVDSRKEFVALDLDGMYRRISEQEELCRQIQRLHPAIQSLQQTCAAHLSLENHDAAGQAENAAWTERLTGVMQKLGTTELEVGRLNQIHAAYLRRSRRTVNVLMNFIGGYAMTYARPASTESSASTVTQKD